MTYGGFIESGGVFAKEMGFLSKAVSGDETRLFMNRVLIEPSDTEEGKFKGAATDGRRLHIVDPLSCPEGIGLEAGEWKILKAGKKLVWMARVTGEGDTGKFPDYRAVIPKEAAAYTAKFEGFLVDGRHSQGLVDFIRGFPEPTVINAAYLLDLGADEIWSVEWTGNNKAVVFTGGNKKAVIMAMIYDRTTGEAA
jgi:hypothetical protein